MLNKNHWIEQHPSCTFTVQMNGSEIYRFICIFGIQIFNIGISQNWKWQTKYTFASTQLCWNQIQIEPTKRAMFRIVLQSFCLISFTSGYSVFHLGFFSLCFVIRIRLLSFLTQFHLNSTLLCNVSIFVYVERFCLYLLDTIPHTHTYWKHIALQQPQIQTQTHTHTCR